ncbi:cation diffusion facilitator family transporter [Pedobacter sp. L105]|uniref:cation diffusion facilitator family transporter n=1 Tax=Pedobacter sp. L105 TaxID=1641871 RepID=UPI00131D0EC8|nr:cation diffusion facilitator family transporter [Pedobacter sp. L105]
MVQSKQTITTISVVSSAGLSALKFVVGIATGSLGLIAEGAHSLLDLLSTLITFIVVRVSSLPPDENHPYGHERAESLGALGGMILLAVTAIWILYQSIVKIVWHPEKPEITVWSFAIIIISLLVDLWRVRSLKKAAAHYKSASLESDAEHFGNDLLGSMAVLTGLFVIFLSRYINLPVWLVDRIDAIAALGVAFAAMKSFWNIGSQAIKSLMDNVPEDLIPRLNALIEQEAGVIPNTVVTKIRYVGNLPHVEVVIGINRELNFEKAHQLTEKIEHSISKDLGSDAQVIVHAEPTAASNEPYSVTVRAIADRLGLRIHNLHVYLVDEKVCLELDMEISSHLHLSEAHRSSERLEKALIAEFKAPVTVNVHLEPLNEKAQKATQNEQLTAEVQQIIHSINDQIILDNVLTVKEGLVLTIKLPLEDSSPLIEAHAIMSNLERKIRSKIDNIVKVHVDPEPISKKS